MTAVQAEGPSAAAMPMASRIDGKAISASASRIIGPSSLRK